MEIGPQKEPFIAEPVEDPFRPSVPVPEREPLPEPTPTPTPTPAPEKVPA
jgi:hypothetical protein